MEVHAINREQWDEYFLHQPSQSGIFLQSYDWGEFQKSVGVNVIRYVYNNQHVQIFEKKLLFGYVCWYIPRSIVSLDVLQHVVQSARTKKIICVTIEPHTALDLSQFQTHKVKSVQPHSTRIIDLQGSEEDVLLRMNQKTRYNIRLSKKHTVEIEMDGKGSYGDEFLKLLKITSSRNQFGVHPDHYYRQQIARDASMLMIARYKGEIVAAHVYYHFGDTLTYLHGASSNVHRDVMAPYALHNEAMRYARTIGCTLFDLWGIDETKWKNLTRFKRGFGGVDVHYPGCFDIPIRNNLYYIYSVCKHR